MNQVIKIRNDSERFFVQKWGFGTVPLGYRYWPAVEPVAGRSLYQVARPLGALNSNMLILYGTHKKNRQDIFDWLVATPSLICFLVILIRVGVQSIARAQSIAHGHIGMLSDKKTKILKNLFYKW
jgi:hypothetical protein